MPSYGEIVGVHLCHTPTRLRYTLAKRCAIEKGGEEKAECERYCGLIKIKPELILKMLNLVFGFLECHGNQARTSVNLFAVSINTIFVQRDTSS